jgi:hypothetical protein
MFFDWMQRAERVGPVKVNTQSERIFTGAGLHEEPDKENILPLYATI